MLARGNPKSVKQISDIANPNIRFVNRNAGSGTRLWLDRELSRLNIKGQQVFGYDKDVKTHSEAAALIANNEADAALGLQAAAHQHGLDFIPLFEERYDFILPRENEKIVSPLLDYLQTSDFRVKLSGLPGYNSSHTGEPIPL
jgi:putative molybdopterin biosynthesis protein